AEPDPLPAGSGGCDEPPNEATRTPISIVRIPVIAVRRMVHSFPVDPSQRIVHEELFRAPSFFLTAGRLLRMLRPCNRFHGSPWVAHRQAEGGDMRRKRLGIVVSGIAALI